MTAYRTPWDEAPAPARAGPAPLPAGAARPATPRGRRSGAARTPPPEAGGAPGWLHHRLTVTGPAEALASFADAARGTGIVPWRHDPARVEEDVLSLALAQPLERRLSAAGCRILARQLRAAIEAHQAWAAARAGPGASCPLDLHALLPVPDALLGRGPDDPRTLAWMRQHWGVTGALRHPSLRLTAVAGQQLPAGHGAAGWGFFTDGGTPHAAVAQFALRWPALRFDLQPRSSD